MKIASYQAPLLPAGSLDAVALIQAKVKFCEEQSVSFLCCPEGVLGGLADYDANPLRLAYTPEQLSEALVPLSSESVTTIIGFTELGEANQIFNSAAIYHRGKILGIYRKVFPAIRSSVYSPGRDLPVFQVSGLTFGIVICNDSNYFEPARVMAAKGASVIFIPTNNGLPSRIDGKKLVNLAGNIDTARAIDNSVWVVRSDVAGEAGGLNCHGSSAITDYEGTRVVASTGPAEDLLIAEIDPQPPLFRRGWDAMRNPAVMKRYTAMLLSMCEPGSIAEDSPAPFGSVSSR